MTSLDEFAAANPRRTPGYGAYIDSLPEDMRQQILDSKAGHATVAKWLHGLGHERVTQQQVGNWRRRNGWQP